MPGLSHIQDPLPSNTPPARHKMTIIPPQYTRSKKAIPAPSSHIPNPRRRSFHRTVTYPASLTNHSRQIIIAVINYLLLKPQAPLQDRLLTPCSPPDRRHHQQPPCIRLIMLLPRTSSQQQRMLARRRAIRMIIIGNEVLMLMLKRKEVRDEDGDGDGSGFTPYQCFFFLLFSLSLTLLSFFFTTLHTCMYSYRR